MTTTITATPTDVAAQDRRRRGDLLRALRKIHGWIGLWGAVLGLLFGSTGILLNHRAVLKIPAARTQESTVQLPLPDPAPTDAKAMAAWLRSTLKLAPRPGRVREEAARPVAWGDQNLTQPAHWTASFATPGANVQMDYWLGNTYVTVRRGDNNLFATLSNLHKGVGVGLGWVLLVDTLAGSIVLLSLTGVILWVGLNRRRQVGGLIVASSLLITVVLALV